MRGNIVIAIRSQFGFFSHRSMIGDDTEEVQEKRRTANCLDTTLCAFQASFLATGDEVDAFWRRDW